MSKESYNFTLGYVVVSVKAKIGKYHRDIIFILNGCGDSFILTFLQYAILYICNE